MRKCEGCHKPDSCIVDYEKQCRPGQCHPQADERFETHHDDCPKLAHEVRALYRVAKLIPTPQHPEGELEYKYRAEGWKVKRDGSNVYRYRMLCRGCIVAVYDREARRKEYEKQCKRALGDDDRTYAQMLAMQANG